MLFDRPLINIVGQSVDVIGDDILSRNIKSGDKERNINLAKADIILDCVPIKEDGMTVGTVAILHNRAEYTKLMEELSGTRYLVDSMRANNHDFTNKLHVILGLIQMGMYDDACSYIQNITMVQRENISKVMNAVSEPAVAALLIGKIARASELNINFVLREGCYYSTADMNLPSEMLITVIGNLLDNAFDAMNESTDYKKHKELMFGIYSKPGAVLITVDDTGSGIKLRDMEHIFENGFSTKGDGRGTGLYQVKAIVENFGGKITVESQEGVGSSFSVSFVKEKVNV
jgi:sensor histidine kinase regulating citrate/malate metabolism